MRLENDVFKGMIECMPLISIDLVVRCQNKVLLGKRINRPAQGFWFVPGGRVRKNETLNDAFNRLTQNELGYSFFRSSANFIRVYEHFYTDSVFGEGEDHPSTHYIVLAYELTTIQQMSIEADDQHADFKWWAIDQLLQDHSVHPYTKDYFR